MKRVIFVVIAVLLVLLVYPSTHPYAKSPNPGVIVGPEVITPFSGDGPPIVYSDSDDGSSDDGDGDDITGWRDGNTRPGGVAPGGSTAPAPVGIGVVLKMWWNFMIWIR